MEAKEAAALRKTWGDKPCGHPWWVDETNNGADTGKVICKTCGRARRKGEPEPPAVKPPKPPTASQRVRKIDPKDITIIQQGKAPVAPPAPVNQKVKELESAVDGVAAMLGSDFAFTAQDEARIDSASGKLRDALGRWRQQKKKRSP